MKIYIVLLVACSCMITCILVSCASTKKIEKAGHQYPAFLQIGHRGTRGLMPENTIPAMLRAIELGANVIELDVHVSKDGKIIVYHDESFNPDYTTLPDGSDIPARERQKYTFYQMNYADIRTFVIGTKAYPAYPQQQKTATYTPLLAELIDSVEGFTKSRKLRPVYYLVEVKSKEKTDGLEQPAPAEFMKLLMNMLDGYRLGDRLIVQSFDIRPLQVLHRTHPKLALGFLTGDKSVTFEQNLAALGFNPVFYNPHYDLVDPGPLEKAHAKGILVTPWTVNDLPLMKRLKAMHVDGIITDYPNFFAELR